MSLGVHFGRCTGMSMGGSCCMFKKWGTRKIKATTGKFMISWPTCIILYLFLRYIGESCGNQTQANGPKKASIRPSSCHRMALIGSTALRIDTPDSDLDVVVYTCNLADHGRSTAAAEARGWWVEVGRTSASKMVSLENFTWLIWDIFCFSSKFA